MNITNAPVHEFYAFLLVFARTSGLISIAPVLGARNLPNTMKAAFALMLSLAMTPLIAPQVGVTPTHLLELVLQLGGETALGLAMGYVARLMFMAVEMAGSLIDTQMGFGFMSLINPFAEAQSSVLSVFQYQLAITLYLLMNGHLLLLGTLAESFYGIAPGLVAPQAGFGTAILPTLQNLFLLAFRIALPAVGVLIVVEIGLGLLARLVPNLNVFFVGAPAKIILGLMTVIILLPAFSLVVGRVVAETSASMARLLPLAR